jgi:hypothetical protein
MSYKSMPRLPSMVNSTSVTGGAALPPAQSWQLSAEPQSVQRPQRRPDHTDDGTGTARDSPGASTNPVLSSAAAAPAPGEMTALTVYAQLFVMSNDVESAPPDACMNQDPH